MQEDHKDTHDSIILRNPQEKDVQQYQALSCILTHLQGTSEVKMKITNRHRLP